MGKEQDNDDGPLKNCLAKVGISWQEIPIFAQRYTKYLIFESFLVKNSNLFDDKNVFV